MKQKTVRLSDFYSLSQGGKVEIFDIDLDKYIQTKYEVGAKAVLCSSKNLRTGTERFYLDFKNIERGIPGNSNQDICRFHGWRGTYNDVATYAHGLRRVTKIRALRDGTVAVTVGRDLYPNDA